MSTVDHHQSAGSASEVARLQKLLDVSAALDGIHDLDALLDRVLQEARAFTNADAGTIYLVEQKRLRFAFNSHGDTAADYGSSDGYDKYRYIDHTMPIDPTSIAGYVAHNAEAVVVDDAYHLATDLPYKFNPVFDREANYHTVSMFTLPLRTNRGRTVGVMQLVNALDQKSGQPVPFAEMDRLTVTYFAREASVAIERAVLTRSILLRMIRMAALRDPNETGPHVNRVAAYAVEIYRCWANRRGVDAAEIKRNQDVLRLGAMMHDVGKIAIADQILKKPGRLTDDERAIMQTHAVVGARLLRGHQSDLDFVSEQIALTHHERWDGTGYPGKIDDIYVDPIVMGPGLAGEQIPLFGRIVGLADVYDALMSKRAYKEAWDEQQVLATIDADSGKHFDPDIVAAFRDVYDVLRAIRGKYSD